MESNMKVEIEVDKIELFATALNNAIIAYEDVLYGIYLGCEIQTQFNKLKTLPFEQLKIRQKCLKNVYRQIQKIESQYKEQRANCEISDDQIVHMNKIIDGLLGGC